MSPHRRPGTTCTASPRPWTSSPRATGSAPTASPPRTTPRTSASTPARRSPSSSSKMTAPSSTRNSSARTSRRPSPTSRKPSGRWSKKAAANPWTCTTARTWTPACTAARFPALGTPTTGPESDRMNTTPPRSTLGTSTTYPPRRASTRACSARSTTTSRASSSRGCTSAAPSAPFAGTLRTTCCTRSTTTTWARLRLGTAFRAHPPTRSRSASSRRCRTSSRLSRIYSCSWSPCSRPRCWSARGCPCTGRIKTRVSSSSPFQSRTTAVSTPVSTSPRRSTSRPPTGSGSDATEWSGTGSTASPRCSATTSSSASRRRIHLPRRSPGGSWATLSA